MKLKDLCLCACVYVYVELFNQQRNLGFPGGARGKESTCQCRRHGFDPWVGKIFCRRKWQALQDCCLGNLMDREAQRATVQDVTTNRTQLSYWTVPYYSQGNLIWEHFHAPKMIASVHCRHSIFLTSISLSQLMTSVGLPFWCVSYNYIHRICIPFCLAMKSCWFSR